MTRILVVDDEPQILRALSINLRARDHQVDTAQTGAQALAAAAARPPEVIILDLGLPDMDGVDVIRGLRGWTAAPIVVLSGRVGSGDKVEALDAGADDYVTKPFAMDELLARMRAVTRRSGGAEETSTARVGAHTVDLAAHRILREPDVSGGPEEGDPGPLTEVRLTPTEWRLLEMLVRHPGKLVSQKQLLAGVWGPAYQTESNYLRLYMAQLRRKLEIEPSRPRHLLTEPGVGYRYQP